MTHTPKTTSTSAPVLLDSIAHLLPEHAGAVVVSGSHGGLSAARFVLAQAHRPWVVFFNDAGVGKDEAGIAALGLLQHEGLAAAAYGHESARIGDAHDGWQHGVLTHVNAQALRLGLLVGMAVAEACVWADPRKNPRPGLG